MRPASLRYPRVQVLNFSRPRVRVRLCRPQRDRSWRATEGPSPNTRTPTRRSTQGWWSNPQAAEADDARYQRLATWSRRSAPREKALHLLLGRRGVGADGRKVFRIGRPEP